MARNSSGLVAIGVFKLFKGIVLAAAGVAALKLVHADLDATINHWVDILRVDPDNRFIQPLLAKLFAVSPKQLKEVSAGTFFYSALLLTEGTGLLLRQRWAEYFTIITTAVFIPLELYELYKHITAAKLLVLAINVVIVVYLVKRRRD